MADKYGKPSGEFVYESGGGRKSLQASGNMSFTGDRGSLTPGFSYLNESQQTQYPDGVVLDQSGRKIGISIGGELFLDSAGDNSLRASAGREVASGDYEARLMQQLLDQGSFVDGINTFGLGADLGPLSADVTRSGDNLSGRAEYSVGDNAKFSVEGSSQSKPRFGFDFVKNFAEGGPIDDVGYAEGGPIENLRVVGNSVYRVAPDGQMFFVRSLGQDPTANTDVFAAPPRADDPSFYASTPEQGSYFGQQAVGMAAPHLKGAYDLASTATTMTPDPNNYAPEAIQRMGKFATNMGIAGLQTFVSPFYGAAGLVGDVAKAAGVPRSEALTGDLGAMLDYAGVLPEGRILGAMADAGAMSRPAKEGIQSLATAESAPPIPAPVPQNKWLQALSGQEVTLPTAQLSPPPSVISVKGPSSRPEVLEPFNPIGPRAGQGPARPSDQKAEALGFNDTVYHSSAATDPFTQFDLDKSYTDVDRRQFQDYLGVHVGTAKAARERHKSVSETKAGYDVNTAPEKRIGAPQGMTMELRARTDNPLTKEKFADLLGVDTDKIFMSNKGPMTEVDLDAIYKKYGNELMSRDPSLAKDYGIIPPKVVAQYLRRDLADKGFTHIPYINRVEDRGNTSFIMLTDRPQGSSAVLRDVRAGFDPSKIDNPDLRFSDGGSVVGSTLSNVDVFALQ